MKPSDYHALIAAEKKRHRKYGNVPTTVDNILFASSKEALRYAELKLMERAGEITLLRIQPKYELKVNGEAICSYLADFQYMAFKEGVGIETVVEDVKSEITRKNPVYRLKKRLMRAIHQIDVVEI